MWGLAENNVQSQCLGVVEVAAFLAFVQVQVPLMSCWFGFYLSLGRGSESQAFFSVAFLDILQCGQTAWELEVKVT